uniref:SURP motif domain-containing protein n=1 Tax=Romanomermis culicivorax TaxID=13658 RepID=A0A915JFV3_ROMCU
MSTSAEAPKAPDDMELKNIIDKLAQFVARNGPEFENMTKQKQKDNPRFSFLYGGDYFQYYVYKVNAEQAIMRKQKMQADQNATSQIQALQQQLRESERNLRLQYDALMKQQEIQVDEAIISQEKVEIMNLAKECQLNLEEFDSQLQLIQNSCSKESISSNKTWFSTHCQTEKSADIVLKYIVNSSRKQNQEIMNLLTSYVPLMFSYVYVIHCNDVSCKEKLDRLKSIWLNQKFFDENNTKKLENCELTRQDHKQFLGQQYQSVVQEIVQKITSQYKQYEMQHQQYSNHVQQQISTLECEHFSVMS